MSRKTPNEEGIVNWCDHKNGQSGKRLMRWLQIDPINSPSHLLGVNDENRLIGPRLLTGETYKITYSSPVRLPFRDPEDQEPCALHVIEITGKLVKVNSGELELLNVKMVICRPDDCTDKEEITADKSHFRLFIDDKIEKV